MDIDRPSTPMLATLLAQANHYTDGDTGAVVPAIQPSTTFARDDTYALPGSFSYGRSANPTTQQAERLLARLDGGEETRLFTSGMAAFTCLIETFEAGDRIVAPRVMYHGALDWLLRVAQRRDIIVDFFDQAEPDALNHTATKAPCALIWIETPVNPTWDVIDIAGAVRTARDAGALIGVDSTVAPPVTTRPLEFGADFVFHSATKYLNGHSDVTGGVLTVREASERWRQIDQVRTYLGGIMPAFEAWLLMRGLRTLAVRYEKACANAMAIARHFEGHRELDAVLYPGLESHRGHEAATRQMTGGFGAMMSLLVKGDAERSRQVAGATGIWLRATSLGGVESLIEHRATVEGPNSVVPENLLRLSVGIEDAEELIADLEQALA